MPKIKFSHEKCGYIAHLTQNALLITLVLKFLSETYLEPCQARIMKGFAKIIHG